MTFKVEPTATDFFIFFKKNLKYTKLG